MDTERFSCGLDDSGQVWWLNGDEGTNLRVDKIVDRDEFGYVRTVRVGGRYFSRDEHDPIGMYREVEP
jgi:hypothetical protein